MAFEVHCWALKRTHRGDNICFCIPVLTLIAKYKPDRFIGVGEFSIRMENWVCNKHKNTLNNFEEEYCTSIFTKCITIYYHVNSYQFTFIQSVCIPLPSPFFKDRTHRPQRDIRDNWRLGSIVVECLTHARKVVSPNADGVKIVFSRLKTRLIHIIFYLQP